MRQLRYKQTLLLNIDPLDIVYDLCGNIWISTACSQGDESPLMILFLRTEDNQVSGLFFGNFCMVSIFFNVSCHGRWLKYEKTSKDHSLVKDVNEKGSAFGNHILRIIIQNYANYCFKHLCLLILADKPSDLYRTGQLRKVNETRDRKSNNEDNADEQDVGTSSSKRAKINDP